MTQISELVIYDVRAIFDRGVFELSSIVKASQAVFFNQKGLGSNLRTVFLKDFLKDCFQVPSCHFLSALYLRAVD